MELCCKIKNVAEGSSTQPSSTDVADGGRNDPEQAATFSSEIRTFIESGEAELAFPPELSAAERKVVHDICYELDLTCKSRGPKKAGGRFITVYKPDAAQSAKLKAQKERAVLRTKSAKAAEPEVGEAAEKPPPDETAAGDGGEGGDGAKRQKV